MCSFLQAEIQNLHDSDPSLPGDKDSTCVGVVVKALQLATRGPARRPAARSMLPSRSLRQMLRRSTGRQ